MATALAITTAIPASANPVVPTASHTVRDGSARFEVLTPTLIRLEYAADGRFEDAALSRRLRALHGQQHLDHAGRAGPPGDRAPLVAGATGAVRVRHRLPSRGRPDQRR